MIAEFALKVLLFIPAFVGNMLPVGKSFKIFKGVPNAPMDFGAKLSDGKRVFGDGKTFLGFALGIAGGTLVGLIQGNSLLGFLLATGALAGDLVGSFIKRRMGLRRGEQVLLLDQLDFVAGALILSWPAWAPPWTLLQVALLCALVVPFHRLSCILGYRAGIKKEPW